MLAPAIETEVADLAVRYGQPQRVAVELSGAPFSPLTLEDRHGEVCMVVRRPRGKLITAKKTFYPAGAFRLLTGGVDHGEPIADALLREVAEETGLEVRITDVLDSIEYWFVQRGTRIHKTVHYFLMEPIGGDLADHDREFDDVRWVRFDQAPEFLTFETERALVARAAEIVDPPSGRAALAPATSPGAASVGQPAPGPIGGTALGGG